MKSVLLSIALFLAGNGLVFPQVSVGNDGNNPDNSAMLEVKSTEKGLLIPRMNFLQRNAILDPAEGLMIYCTNCDDDSTGVLCIFQGGSWYNFYGECKVPKVPVAGNHVADYTQITWNWAAVPIALGYKWNTINDYNTATELGLVISKNETGLECSKDYTRYLWAYNACGNATPLVLTKSTTECACGMSFTINHSTSGGVAPVNKTVTYGTVKNVPGEPSKCWITSNLGADHQASSVSDTSEASAGWYWQFNEKQGYKHTGSVRTPNSTWAYTDAETDWDPDNDPCALELGDAWRIPTMTEWTNVDSYGNWSNWNGPWNSPLKLHAAGYLNTWDGSLTNRGNSGNYWARTQTYINMMEYGYYVGDKLYFDNSNSYTSYDYKSSGYTLRCVKDSLCPTVPSAPTEGVHESHSTYIIWKCEADTCALYYRWNTTDDFGTSLCSSGGCYYNSYFQGGLQCATSHTLYVWAVNGYGHSESTELNASTTETAPATPTEGTHVANYTQITWKWSMVYDANGYKWNTTNNYETATELGFIDTTKIETGLACGTEYTRYAWAFNGCGHSSPVTLTQSTLTFTCGDSMTVGYVAGVAPVYKTVTYGTVSNIPGETSKCWITSNLGADHQANSVDDATEASAGWYWQFNRQQGYKHGGIYPEPSWTITAIDENSNWTAGHDPCALSFGCGWRLPTSTEWTNVDASGNWDDWNGPWNSALKMHAAGYIANNTGNLYVRGTWGYYWSSEQAASISGWELNFGNSNCGVSNGTKAHGFSVRCIRE